MVTCPECGGEAGLLGVLGKRRVMVCRDCGCEFEDHEGGTDEGE